MQDLDDFTDSDEYYAEQQALTFDDMVSFTMFAEMSVVLAAAIVFLVILYFTV